MDHMITPELTAAFTRRAAALGYEIRQTQQAGDEAAADRIPQRQ